MGGPAVLVVFPMQSPYRKADNRRSHNKGARPVIEEAGWTKCEAGLRCAPLQPGGDSEAGFDLSQQFLHWNGLREDMVRAGFQAGHDFA